jgi:predicted RNA-binding Zn ribbon-like protein
VRSLLLPASDPTPPNLGGRACLAVVNTELWRHEVGGRDVLATVADGAFFLGRMHAVAPGGVEPLQREDAAAEAALARLRALRAPLHAVFWGLYQGRRPTPADLAAIDEHLAEALGHVRLQDGGERVLPDYAAPDAHPFDTLRLLAARSAADVLAPPREVAHVKRCAGEHCGFLFVDDSRNQTRRWCDTKVCGNRARVKAHYARSRGRRGQA